jgi:NAD-dependent dihydropyrimidine dehydrogenase PreA subunit
VAEIKEWKSSDWTIKIDHGKCVGAGECVDICPSSVFVLAGGKSTAPNARECVECCSCVEVCPEEAIEHSSC